MRVALVTPIAAPSVRGNAVTAARLLQGLRAAGVTAEILDLSRLAADRLASRLAGLAPDLVHAFHAFRGAPAVRRWARARGIPLVVSLTGTDVNVDLFHAERRAETIVSIRDARALVAFHESIQAIVAREVPEAAARLHVIPQSVTLGEEPYDLPAFVPPNPGEVRFLLPAGIRKVKNVLFPLAPLGRLARRHPLRLLLAGPVIEDEEGVRLVEALKGVDWAGYLGEVPHEQMAALLDAVDVVLNCSVSEGGMANSVLEAMSRGKAVLVSDIEGNRSVVEGDTDGLLFRDADEFQRQAERLIRDAALRARLGAAARDKVARLYPPAREVAAHLTLYRTLLAG